MSITPAFSGEVQFAGYADSSRSGPRITLRLSEREDLQAFVGKEGKRYMLALVEIGEDERPVQPEPEKPKGGALAKLAGMWCESPDFQEWITTTGFPDAVWPSGNSAAECAANGIRAICRIESRAELDNDPAAEERFQRLIRGPYMKHIATREYA